MRKNQTIHHQLIKKHMVKALMLVFFTIIFASTASAQMQATEITRKDVVQADPQLQRKFANNMPSGFIVTDLVNYPTGRGDDKYRDASLEYLTVDHFYNDLTAHQRLVVLLDPDLYMVAPDESYFPFLLIGQ